jgi:hypothetical protein
MATKGSLGGRLLVSFGAGVLLTVFFLIVGLVRVGRELFESLLWPGSLPARKVYGGFHGIQPILLALVGNSLFYAILWFFGASILKGARTKRWSSKA